MPCILNLFSIFFHLQAYKLYKKGRCLEIVDPTLGSSVVTEQVETCIRLGLLCTQGDPQLRPTTGRAVLMLSRKPGNREEPITRPGVAGSRYRRLPRNLFPISSSSTTVDDDDSDRSHIDSSNCDTTITTTTTTSATRTISGTPQVDSRGKRPLHG